MLCKTCNDTRHFCGYHGTDPCDCAGTDCADCWGKGLEAEIASAMWAGDTDRLDELAPCRCCCHEHTFDDCPARLWHACRGQGMPTHDDLKSWADHYGMTLNEFLT